ncbi:HD domain-containing protein [Clostridium botulinum]|uniref:HD domain-containing protein n=1 Tax=Clostridium botulinum TaxID=1491 RepID=A0A846K5D7_CLOBO|nr:HD domain-containing phosphohydrolase [Clostridium botulinum]ALT05280.1 metal dependent phosphohydrolase with conserved 'HD' motif [Clostridium botulinum]KOR55634.1 hypothetical protein ADT22_15480 [Clostridium botulinum]NFH90603.1 HD domain-containing protein [Clostridium botulinum]NFI19129.1 HD domain-containing protein [Clostridium botulinum]NFN06388.1 HD domain-containing protein [Clostridium botulinum]
MKVVNLEDIKHGIRVANYSKEIAKQLDLSDKKIKEIYFSGLFHDIGKAYLNQNILNKPSMLSTIEKTEISQHPMFSYEEVLKSGYSKEVAFNVLYHHENWDGSGYPKGIKKNSIPVGARILKIADVFDALTTSRPYRKKLSFDETLNIMENERTTYDPELYYIFTNYIIKKYKENGNFNINEIQNI